MIKKGPREEHTHTRTHGTYDIRKHVHTLQTRVHI